MRKILTVCRNGFIALSVLVVLTGAGRPASAQTADASDSIRDEYRATLVITRPAAERERLILFGYLGVVKSEDKHVTTLYYSPPGLIYKPKKWMEIWGGMFGIYNNYSNQDNSWELRPLTGVKFYAPNKAKANLFNFTRLEYRSIHQSGTTTSTPRLRNRVGLEVPFTQARAWAPKTWYGLADVEHFWRLDDGYLERYRVRGGIGYVLNTTWRAEFIYHAEFSGGKGEDKTYKDNIWRLNIKLSLPRRGQRVSIPAEIDD